MIGLVVAGAHDARRRDGRRRRGRGRRVSSDGRDQLAAEDAAPPRLWRAGVMRRREVSRLVPRVREVRGLTWRDMGDFQPLVPRIGFASHRSRMMALPHRPCLL